MLLKRKHRRHVAEGSWAVSYVDMLTLLLCFFIIFYNTSQQNTAETANPSALQKVIMDLNMKNAAVAAAAGGAVSLSSANSATTAGASAAKATSQLSAPDLQLLETIKKQVEGKVSAETKIKQKSLDVDFSGVSFFNLGSTHLRPDAIDPVTDMIKLLAPHKNSIRVVVQGHTDSTPFGRYNVSDNWELSVLRATSVLKLFIKNGFSQEALSAEGFADTQTAKNSAVGLANQRRITLRIEPRLK